MCHYIRAYLRKDHVGINVLLGRLPASRGWGLGFLFFYLQRSLDQFRCAGWRRRSFVAQACEPSTHVLLLSITLHAARCALTCALATSSLMNINFKEGPAFKLQWRRRNHHKHIIAHTSNQTISHTVSANQSQEPIKQDANTHSPACLVSSPTERSPTLAEEGRIQSPYWKRKKPATPSRCYLQTVSGSERTADRRSNSNQYSKQTAGKLSL